MLDLLRARVAYRYASYSSDPHNLQIVLKTRERKWFENYLLLKKLFRLPDDVLHQRNCSKEYCPCLLILFYNEQMQGRMRVYSSSKSPTILNFTKVSLIFAYSTHEYRRTELDGRGWGTELDGRGWVTELDGRGWGRLFW